MKRIQQIAAAVMAAVVISTTAYSYTLPVYAVGETLLIDLLVGFVISLTASYTGEALNEIYTESDIADGIGDYFYGKTDALVTYVNNLVDVGYITVDFLKKLDEAGYYVKDGTLNSPEAVDVLLSLPCTGILVNDTLIDLATSNEFCIKDTSGKEFSYISHVDDAVAQDVYFVNTALPDNVYIGFNSSVVPGYAVMNGYDASLAHVQYNSLSLQGYAVVQTPLTTGDVGVYHWISSIYLDFKNTSFSIYSGMKTYYYNPSNINGGYDIGSLSTVQPTYCFKSSGAKLYQTAYSETNVSAYPVYLAPTNNQYIVCTYQGVIYVVLPSGVVLDGNKSTSPSGVVTDDDVLNSVDSIMGGIGFGSFLALLLNSITGVDDTGDGTDVGTGSGTQAKTIGLSKEGIDHISEAVNEYYQTTTKNYYQDTSYIDGDTYIENITNIYEQAAVEYPAIEIPDVNVDDAGIIASIKAIPGEIEKVLTDVFVPDVALYRTYLNTIKGKFAFVDVWTSYGKDVITLLFDADPEIPVIIIDFGKAESEYNYGGIAYALDMTWYERFKPLVDNIIVSISYMVFFYWLFKNLPEIISGSVLSRKDQAAVDGVSRFLSEGHKTDNKYDIDDW